MPNDELDLLFAAPSEEEKPKSVRETRRQVDTSREQAVAASDNKSLMDELFDIQQVMSPSEAFLEGGKKGAVRGGGALAGGAMGARLGSVVGPKGAGLGFVAGTIVGAEGMDWAAEKLGFTTSSDEISAENKPLYNAGETFAETALLMNAPYTLKTGLFGKGRIGGWIDDVITYAGKNKKKYLAIETLSAGGAGAGAGAAEVIDPGDELTRMGAEITGGTVASLTPGKLVLQGFIGLKNKLSGPLNRFTESGRQDQAVTVIRELMETYGEDPEKLVTLINQGALEIDGVPVDLSTAQQTGSLSLTALTGFLAKRDPEFATEVGKKGSEAAKAMEKLISTIESTGDPMLIQQAAELKQDLFRSRLNANITAAEEQAALTASKITVERGSSREGLSQQAFEIIDESLQAARAAERELYQAVPVVDVQSVPNLKSAFNEEEARLLLEENMPAIVSKFVGRADTPTVGVPERLTPESAADFLESVTQGTTKPVNTKELMRFRSIMLDAAREADIAGKSQDARMYGQLADAALNDLDNAFGTTDNAYNTARMFTRELHDAYSRSFVGKTLASTKYGERIPPELMLKRAVSSGKEVASLQLRELDDAVKFAVERGEMEPTAISDMLELQERYLRSIAADMFDMNGKLKSVEQVSKFAQDNKDLLEKFPTLKSQLDDAVSGKITLDEVTRSLTGQTEYIEQKSLFAKLTAIKNEDPIRVVSGILRSGKTRYGDLDEILSFTTEGDFDLDDVNNAVKTVIWEALRTNNTTPEGRLKVSNMMSSLFDPPSKGQPSLADYMVSKGIITNDQLGTVKQLFDRLGQIEIAMNAKNPLQGLDTDLDFITDLGVRIVSSKAGLAISQTTGADANSLVVAAASVRAGKALFDKIPAGKLEAVLRQAMVDPTFAKMLMEKSPDKIKYMENLRQLHAYMLNAGLLGGVDVMNQQINQGEQQ